MWKFLSRTKEICLKSTYTVNALREKSRELSCFPRDGQCKARSEDFGDREKHDKETSWESKAQVQHSWIGALGWSGILVLGWYLSQPTRLRTILCNKPYVDDSKYQSPGQILINAVFAQPVHQILPKAITSDAQSHDTSQFVHETLDQAADNFAQAHGSVENRLGVELARRQRHNEAVSLFQKAADRGHITAAFNLGLCHELGLGVSQNFRKAAEYYEMATLGGHATATYNLGVFYVHGWGGKTADRVQAKHLFIAAARLGQVDARRALGLADTHAQRSSAKPFKNDTITNLVQESVQNYNAMMEV